MTNDYAVNQKPSAAPYVLGGAAAGAAGGFALQKWADVGINTPKYKSWQEAVNDVNDEYVTKKINNSKDEVKEAWEAIQAHRKAMADADKKLTELIPEQLRNTEEGKKFIESTKNRFLKSIELDKTVINDIKAGKFEGISKDIFNGLSEGEINAKLGELVSTKPDALGNYSKEMEKLFNESFTAGQNLAKMAESEGVKLVAEGVTLEEYLVNFMKKSEPTIKAAKEAQEKLTQDLLKKCKSPNMWATVGVGAAALALLGLLIAPKGNKQ